jgi:hypothetical protein
MNIEYEHKEIGRNHSFEGVSFSKTEIENAFQNSVKEKLLDNEGTNELVGNFEEEFNDIKTTDFDDTYLLNILKLDDIVSEHKSWRIGEAFAEYYIETNSAAKFYINELRDARNIFGNKTGADLLGFIEIAGETIFLFGEVKTSDDKSSPPNILYSRKNKKGYVEKGMIDQLKDLSDNLVIKRQLIRNMAFKVKDLEKANQFRIDYLQSVKNFKYDKFHLFGVLVRDTIPTKKDLESRFKSLSADIKKETNLKLIALYVPVKMEHWNKMVNN